MWSVYSFNIYWSPAVFHPVLGTRGTKTKDNANPGGGHSSEWEADESSTV